MHIHNLRFLFWSIRLNTKIYLKYIIRLDFNYELKKNLNLPCFSCYLFQMRHDELNVLDINITSYEVLKGLNSITFLVSSKTIQSWLHLILDAFKCIWNEKVHQKCKKCILVILEIDMKRYEKNLITCKPLNISWI